MTMKLDDSMYIVIPTAIVQDERISRSAALLYGILGGLSNSCGQCFATNAYLAEVMACTDRNIRRMLKELNESGYIRTDILTADSGEVLQRYISIQNFTGMKKMAEIAPETPEKPKKPKKPEVPRTAYGSQKNVLLTAKQYTDLKTMYPNIDDEIENMSLYLASHGKSYSNYYAALLNWMRGKRAEQPQSGVYQPQSQQKEDTYNGVMY